MSKSSKKSQSVSTTVAEPVQAKVNSVLETKTETVEAESKDNLTYTSYIELQNELAAIQESLSVLRSNLKKHYKLTSKQLNKMNRGKRQNTSLRSPTGFGKPCFVPPSLRTLLKISEDECVTRPTVTKKLYSYIKENSLFDANDKRLLRVNDNLSKALQLTPQEVKLINSSTSPYLLNDGKEKKQVDNNAFSFYNIQRYVARLYPKQEPETKQVVEVKKEKAVVEVVAETKQGASQPSKKSK
jgi:chromatin remodeling complex protein RSC6